MKAAGNRSPDELFQFRFVGLQWDKPSRVPACDFPHTWMKGLEDGSESVCLRQNIEEPT